MGWTQPAQVHLYRLARTPDGDQLVAVGRSQAPPIRSTTALLAAQTLGTGESLAVPIRRGPAGLWWQYDGRELADRAQGAQSARGAAPLSQ